MDIPSVANKVYNRLKASWPFYRCPARFIYGKDMREKNKSLSVRVKMWDFDYSDGPGDYGKSLRKWTSDVLKDKSIENFIHSSDDFIVLASQVLREDE